jgi:hypothetical protein
VHAAGWWASVLSPELDEQAGTWFVFLIQVREFPWKRDDARPLVPGSEPGGARGQTREWKVWLSADRYRKSRESRRRMSAWRDYHSASNQTNWPGDACTSRAVAPKGSSFRCKAILKATLTAGTRAGRTRTGRRGAARARRQIPAPVLRLLAFCQSGLPSEDFPRAARRSPRT